MLLTFSLAAGLLTQFHNKQALSAIVELKMQLQDPGNLE
jgi:hypothetical protein